jgi:hypothetical protein
MKQYAIRLLEVNIEQFYMKLILVCLILYVYMFNFLNCYVCSFLCIVCIFEIEVEGVHSVVCVMNNINMGFITVKHNLYIILKIIN